MRNYVTHYPRYIDGIDGLRAVAVLGVIIYHANSRWLPGGYAGVDIFFVISGFLLVHVNNKGEPLDFIDYLRRRASRVLPASMFVMIVTMAIVWALMTKTELAWQAPKMVSAAAFVANIKFMIRGGYFSDSDQVNLFLHYWSLSLEEQYYIIFPIILIIVSRSSKKISITAIFLALLASMISCIYLTRINQPFAFFMLPTRLWEFLSGAILAISGGQLRWGNKSYLIAWSGLILIFSYYIIGADTAAFPGWSAVFPVLGATMMISTISREINPLKEILGGRIIQFIGRMSFSIYLWHWPVFKIVDELLPDAEISQTIEVLKKLSITSILSLVTYHLIEKKLRGLLNRLDQSKVLCSFVVLILTLIVCGVFIRNHYFIDCRLDDIARGGVRLAKGEGLNIALIGDSNAGMYATTIREVAIETGSSATSFAASGTTPLPGIAGDISWSLTKDQLYRIHPDVVIYALQWSTKIEQGADRIHKAIYELSRITGKVLAAS